MFDMARLMPRDLIDDLPSQLENMIQTASRHADFDQFEFTNDQNGDPCWKSESVQNFRQV